MHMRLPEYADMRAKFGLPRDGMGSNFFISNYVVRDVLEQKYIFCCSTEPDISRIELDEAIFEISDLDLFAHRLAMSRPDVLCGFACGPVKYEVRSVDPFRQGLLSNDPFCKSHLLAAERELRIVWDTRTATEPYLRITAPKVARLITPIE
jgi:hypothetical protein